MTNNRRYVLVVEDDPRIAGSVVRGLRAAGFDAELATNGREGLRLTQARRPDLIVLDLMLPEKSGFAVLEHLKGTAPPPIIVVTARSSLEERLRCFELGAVDYLAKPFFVEELVARIKVRLDLRDRTGPRVLAFDEVAVDLDGRTVAVSGEYKDLTRHEFDILAFLVNHPGRVISRRELSEGALPVEGDRDERTINSHVARIRKKLGSPGGDRIRAIRGIGYRFDAAD